MVCKIPENQVITDNWVTFIDSVILFQFRFHSRIREFLPK